MQISPIAAKFMERHLKDFERPVILVYDTKSYGWWGLERRTRVKLAEYPFLSPDNLVDRKVKFIKLDDVENAPCDVYLEHDMIDLVRKGIVELEKIGMFRQLNLNF